MTPQWAQKHNLDDVEKFTHKPLDCSDLSVKFIREILRKLENNKACVINVMLEAIEYLQQWLSLDSLSLAYSCLQIILEVFNMVAKYLVTPHKTFNLCLIKYALGLKVTVIISVLQQDGRFRPR